MGHKEQELGQPPAAAPPPPYSEVAPGASAAPSSRQIYGAPPPAQVNRQFPPAFSIYRSGLLSSVYTLGEHQNQPIYAIKTHTGWSGQPDVVLHSGPSEKSHPLAAVDAVTFSRSATVQLPPLPGSGRTEETLNHSGGFGHGTFDFAIEVSSDGRREHFEWRHSHGAEVDSLGGSSSGWKLVRPASGQKEVVAVWAGVNMSMSKELNFRFVNSGATGALGERWAVMAVITALRIWDKENQDKRNATAAA